MEKYIGAKIIEAEPATDQDVIMFLGKDLPDGVEPKPGYKVVYSDGYVSWSPKEVFETCYRKLTPGEYAMFAYTEH